MSSLPANPIRTLLAAILQRLAIISLITLILALLATTPYFARTVLYFLNLVPIHTNPVAARGHIAVLADENQLPGSPLWLMQYTYFDDVERMAADPQESQLEAVIDSTPEQIMQRAFFTNLQDNEQTRTKFSAAPVTVAQGLAMTGLTSGTLEPVTAVSDNTTAIVVLGGGLGRDSQKQIVPNIFTRIRLATALAHTRQTRLPLMLSGVESPWMQDWLRQHGGQANWMEKRSMNTCENARFTALLLQHLGGAPRVDIVTDAYHMPRVRRWFAVNGIETVPVIAPLPGDPVSGWPQGRNLVHTRRAIHEAVALLRDLSFGDINCREVP